MLKLVADDTPQAGKLAEQEQIDALLAEREEIDRQIEERRANLARLSGTH